MPLVLEGHNKSMYFKKDARLYLIIAVFFLIGATLIGRLFYLQIIQYNVYAALSEKLHQTDKALVPMRGEIYVNDGGTMYPVVVNKDYYLAFADPREILEDQAFVNAISTILKISPDEQQNFLKKIADKNDPYEPIKKKVEVDAMVELKGLGIPGLYFTRESYRMYSEKGLGGHIFGFVDSAGSGKYGIEGYMDKELYGIEGYARNIQDVFGSTAAAKDYENKKTIDGENIVLTIDKSIQYKSCEEIRIGVEEFQATGGTVIVMDPSTGKVIAMCSYPDFDPENFNKTESLNYFNNPATFYAYEPGSIFKTITFAIGLDLGKITPKSTYEDTGEVKIIGLKPIKNSDLKAHGIQTMTETLEKSLNTGAVYVEEKIGDDNFRKYVEDFGFGRATGIELDSESLGNISSLSKRGQIYSMTASFGQGITITSMQFITAFSSLINGGNLMKPYIVDTILKETETISETKPQIVRQVISEAASSMITNMMVSVVENGYSNKAKIEGYYVGGKTGTAQVAGSEGKYGNETIHTFIGFAPAYNPKFTILIKMDNPKKFDFSSETATLVFKNLAEYILHYYNIPPEKEIEKK